MITFTPSPLPVITPLGDAYVIYCESGGMFENDIWTCVLCDSGEVRHFATDQVRVYKNATFQIKEESNYEDKEGSKKDSL